MLTLKWPAWPHWWQSTLLHSSSQSTLDNAVKEKELQIHKGPTSHMKCHLFRSYNDIKMLCLRSFGGELQVKTSICFRIALSFHVKRCCPLAHTWIHQFDDPTHLNTDDTSTRRSWKSDQWTPDYRLTRSISELQPPTRCLFFSNLV